MQSTQPRTPTDIYRELGLFDKTNNAPKLPEHRLALLEKREIGFDWVHMGTSALAIRDLLEVIRSTQYLAVPRTGHFGNWDDIAKGRAGMLDYNKAVCGRNLGYPLILDFNQTEDSALEAGDWIYMPGSIIAEGRRKRLKLMSWNGEEFADCDPNEAYFTPFVMVRNNGGLIPLSEVHRNRMNRLPGFEFRYQSSFLRHNEQLMVEIFHELIEDARSRADHKALQRVVDRFVFKNGKVHRAPVEFRGPGFWCQGTYFANTAEFVAAAMLPFKAADEPRAFFENIGDLPELMPLASAPMIGMLLAVFNSHYPEVSICRDRMTRPGNPHLHWGALGMAGYPPRNRGYFFTNAGKVRKLHQAVVDRFSDLDPVYYVLLPAAIFSLFPSSAIDRDVELIEDLVAQVHTKTDNLIHKSNLLAPEIENCVREWIAQRRSHLSDYFVGRFASRRSVLTHKPAPEAGEPIEPEGFDALTLQQASMMVGVLHEAIGELAATS